MDKSSGMPSTTHPSGPVVSWHGSAAGSTGTPGQLQPEATLSDAPSAKRERRSPSPHVVIPQVIADGADLSLEMSSDDSLSRVGEELVQLAAATPPPATGMAMVLRPGLPKPTRTAKARSSSLSTGSRGMKMKRTSSPAPKRSPLELHKLVQECRAEGERDIEARMRTLESQRETDHAFLLKMAQYTEGASLPATVP